MTVDKRVADLLLIVARLAMRFEPAGVVHRLHKGSTIGFVEHAVGTPKHGGTLLLRVRVEAVDVAGHFDLLAQRPVSQSPDDGFDDAQYRRDREIRRDRRARPLRLGQRRHVAETHHALDVLRMEPGAHATVFNGQGVEATVEIAAVEKGRIALKKISVAKSAPLACNVTLGQAIPKGKNMYLINAQCEIAEALRESHGTGRGRDRAVRGQLSSWSRKREA